MTAQQGIGNGTRTTPKLFRDLRKQTFACSTGAGFDHETVKRMLNGANLRPWDVGQFRNFDWFPSSVEDAAGRGQFCHHDHAVPWRLVRGLIGHNSLLNSGEPKRIAKPSGHVDWTLVRDNLRPVFQAVIVKHIIHDWNGEKSHAILKNCHAAMSSE